LLRFVLEFRAESRDPLNVYVPFRASRIDSSSMYNRSSRRVFLDPMPTQTRSKTAPSSGENGFSLIPDEKLLRLYAALLKCRMIEEYAGALLKKSRISASPSSMYGHEASAVGVAIDLLAGDTLALCHDDCLSAAFVKGSPLSRLFASLHARIAGRGSRVSCAVRLQAALRAASAKKSGKKQKIVVAFRGALRAESPNEPALWRSAMRRAGGKRMPILFVCHTHGDYEEDLWKTQDLRFPRIAVDGNDAVAIYRVASEAIAHARRGNGPTLIECQTLPSPGPKRNRGREAGDPILDMENYLIRKGLFTARLKAEMTSGFKLELRSARRAFAPRPHAHE
jgi:TPP-dependent pyruvate/acetoin dehydrogenase alpha subunit